MRDRAMQALYLLGLDPIVETLGDGHSYGFRLERCCADAMERVHNIFSNANSACWVMEADITACYDRISWEWLLKDNNIPMDKEVLRKWLQAGFLQKNVWFATTEGTPQGGIISPALANRTLDGLQALLKKRFPISSRATTKFIWIGMRMTSSCRACPRNSLKLKSNLSWYNS